jgi:L-ascorbate metabolism protein UlaG (beta-lactamase superfamily)
VFGDMALIHRFFKPDLALVCIGGHFTMDPERAAYALRELIRPKVLPGVAEPKRANAIRLSGRRSGSL